MHHEWIISSAIWYNIYNFRSTRRKFLNVKITRVELKFCTNEKKKHFNGAYSIYKSAQGAVATMLREKEYNKNYKQIWDNLINMKYATKAGRLQIMTSCLDNRNLSVNRSKNHSTRSLKSYRKFPNWIFGWH